MNSTNINIVCPYCNDQLKDHKFNVAGIYTLYLCDMMPNDGRIWCIPELHTSINHPSKVNKI